MKNLLILLLILFSQCDLGLDFVDENCEDGWFDKKSDLGTYDIKTIPNKEVAIGDTIWVKQKEYWKSYQNCDSNYGVLDIEHVLANPEVAVPFVSDEYIGVLAKALGETRVVIYGRVQMRRNDTDYYNYEIQSFTVDVKDSNVDVAEKPEDAITPFLDINDVSVTPEGNRVELVIETNPTMELNSSVNYSVSPTLELFRDNINEDLIYTRSSNNPNSFEFPWDSTTQKMYIFVAYKNPAAWDDEQQKPVEGVNQNAGWFFGIESDPITKPINERTFKVIGID